MTILTLDVKKVEGLIFNGDYEKAADEIFDVIENRENPDKEFYPLKSAICPNMKKITIDKVLNSLETLEPKIKIPEEIIKKAKKPLNKMMEVGRGD